MPITAKNPPVTSPAGICSAAPLPVSANESLSNAASSVNDVLSRRQSVKSGGDTVPPMLIRLLERASCRRARADRDRDTAAAAAARRSPRRKSRSCRRCRSPASTPSTAVKPGLRLQRSKRVLDVLPDHLDPPPIPAQPGGMHDRAERRAAAMRSASACRAARRARRCRQTRRATRAASRGECRTAPAAPPHEERRSHQRSMISRAPRAVCRRAAAIDRTPPPRRAPSRRARSACNSGAPDGRRRARRLVFPRRLHEPVALEPAERGIDRAARQPGLVDDVEAVLIAVGNGLQHADGGNGRVVSWLYDEILHSLRRQWRDERLARRRLKFKV